MREQETDRVLIVGGGPVGLVLALVLARHGAGSLVLEARPAPTPAEESRAITWMPRGWSCSAGWAWPSASGSAAWPATPTSSTPAARSAASSPSRPATATTAPSRPSPTSSWPTRPTRPSRSSTWTQHAPGAVLLRPWALAAHLPDQPRRGPRGHGDEPAATRILRERCPAAAPRRLLWASAFRLGQGQSARYRVGRWLLAGDAAHAMGPSAGAGMMLGVFGAWRLGWRLARVTVDAAPQELLDDYGREQRAAAAQVQQANARIFRNLAVRSRP